MIHPFTVNNQHFVLDVHSGAVHMPDDLAYDILTGAPLDGYSEEAVAAAQAEIDSLISKGQLFSSLAAGIKESEIDFTNNRPQIVKSLCLHIAHDCNLRCKYCFASELLDTEKASPQARSDSLSVPEKGDAHIKNSRALMSPEIGKKAIDFLIENSGARRNLEVDFFGGEPTLNFDTVKAIVEYARSREAEADKNFRFTLTTNGLLLDDDKIEYINRYMDNVVLSLDGRKEVNDKMRGACYDKVLPKFQKLVEARGRQNYYIRGTYTRENPDFAKDVLHIADLGFSQISVEPVIASPRASYAIRQEDIPALCREYEHLAAMMLDRHSKGREKFNFFHFMIDLENGPCAAKRITGCGAGTEYLAVTPEGDLYPCHQFVGDKQFLLGNLDDGVIKADWQEKFSRLNVYTKPECAGCWAKYYCGGGCAANAFYTNGDIAKSDLTGCELQKKRTECALYLLGNDC